MYLRAYGALGSQGLQLVVAALSPALAAVRRVDETIRWGMLPLVWGPGHSA